MKTKHLFASLLACVLTTPAMAATLITGHGVDSCAEFTQSRIISPAVEESYFVWTQGFMTGVNTILLVQKANNYNLGAQSEDSQKKALREYCSAHPNDNFETAALKILFAYPQVPPAK